MHFTWETAGEATSYISIAIVDPFLPKELLSH